jgi:DNA-binding NtrC family response regulator
MIRTGLGTIVVIDDDQVHLHYLATLLTCAGHTVHSFANSPKARAHIDREPPDLVITDLFMPARDGFEVLRHIKRDTPSLPVVTMGERIHGPGYLYLESSVMQGASGSLRKAVMPLEVIDLIQQLIVNSGSQLRATDSPTG